MNNQCELCNSQKEEYRLISQSSKVFCIANREMIRPGHVMILPKRHVTALHNLNAEESEEVLQMIGKTITKLKETYNEDPIVFLNTGSHSTQAHLHFHIIPSNKGLRNLMGDEQKTTSLSEFRAVREALRYE